MPTSPFCALDQAYGTWDNDEIKNKNRNDRNVSQQPQPQPPPQPQPNQPSQSPKPPSDINVSYDSGGDIRSFCPNCKNCLNKNDSLQQKVIDQNIWPRVRWIPQDPQSYIPFDPYNRYWANTNQISGREDFGNSYDTIKKSDIVEILLKITIFVVAVLFIILLADTIFKNRETSIVK